MSTRYGSPAVTHTHSRNAYVYRLPRISAVLMHFWLADPRQRVSGAKRYYYADVVYN